VTNIKEFRESRFANQRHRFSQINTDLDVGLLKII